MDHPQKVIITNNNAFTNTTPAPAKIIVVGAGISGLTAARFLSDCTATTNLVDVLVLEANPERLGGRIWSYEIPNFPNAKVDLGAMWLHKGSDVKHPIRRLAELTNIRLEKHDFYSQCREKLYDLEGKICSSDITAFVGYIEKVLSEHFFQRLQEQQKNFGNAGCKDMSFQQALEESAESSKKIMNRGIIKYFDLPSIESYHGSTIDKLSLMFCEGIPNDPNEMIFEEDSKDLIPVDGYFQIVEKLISTGRRKFLIDMDRNVKSVKYCERQLVIIEATNSKGENFTYKANHVIIAVPLGILKSGQILFSPPLPREHLVAVRNIGFGNFVKVLLVFDEVFWPQDVSFLCTESDRPRGFPLGFINVHKINKSPALLAIICSEGAKLADSTTEDEIIMRILNRLKLIYGRKVEERKIVFKKIIRWSMDPNFLGAYSFAQIGMNKEDAYNIRTPIDGKIFFAGEHTSMPEAQHGTVLGAYLSGLRSAKEVLKERNVDIQNIKAPHEEEMPRFPSKL